MGRRAGLMDVLACICHNGRGTAMGMQMRGKTLGSAHFSPPPSDLQGRSIRTVKREKSGLRLRVACFAVAIAASWAALLVLVWLIFRF